MKKLVIGVLAHVDAGKTTLSESLLYLGGSIRKIGRVDNGDAFLDTHELERSRGITIFAKQAELHLGDTQVTLLDTPGHVDFSAEMERTLQVLDYAILVISGVDGVQGHTHTLWRLLKQYQIPTILFINKMDQNGTNREELMQNLKKNLHEFCLDFGIEQKQVQFMENLAMCEEVLLENYLETGVVETQEIARLIAERKVFPCYFGSALKSIGIEQFAQGIEQYTQSKDYPDEFGARIFKIVRDEQGNRLTYMKVTGGKLKVKAVLGDDEKVNQIRIYSGAKYELVNEVLAGTVCAVTGLRKTYAGEGLGIEAETICPILEPVLKYQIQLPPECDANSTLIKLRQLEEEEPELHIAWDEQLQEIQVQLMGEVQIEVLQSLIKERYGFVVEFGIGNIVYKESILEPVEGVGHFEPLRHYAEVHLLLEPGEPGTGLQFDTDCSEDILNRSWQRLILTHLMEKEYRGVLTGSVVTDMKITLVAGRAHQKHTEGGDFRQATYRAFRQGLKKAKSVLLEPYYEYQLEVPTDMIGRAISDIEKMSGRFLPPVVEGEMSVLTGVVPVATMNGYQKEVISYSKGRGKLGCSLAGYQVCHNADEVIKNIGYDSEGDLANPTCSVFCAHGAGFIVAWDKVKDYMHVESGLNFPETLDEQITTRGQNESLQSSTNQKKSVNGYDSYQNEKELEEIFTRTFGPVKKERNTFQKKVIHSHDIQTKETQVRKSKEEEFLLIDGYNIIYAWDELHEVAEINMDGARNKLLDILCNYQGYKKCNLIAVFDAYRVVGHQVETIDYHNIQVVYTKEAETADQYIEKFAHQMGHKYNVTVATSDGLEQIIIQGQGCRLLSAREFKEEIELTNTYIREEYLNQETHSRNYLFDHLSEEEAKHMENVRLGKVK